MKDNDMKTLKNLLVATAVLTIGAALSAKAGDAFYSPKAKEVADAMKKVPTSAEAGNLAIRPVGNAKAMEVAGSLQIVPARADVDLAHAARPTLTPKDAGYETAWRNNAVREIQIAPLK